MDIPLHRPYISLIHGRHLQFSFLKWPLIKLNPGPHTSYWTLDMPGLITSRIQMRRNLALVQVICYFPKGKSTMTGESVKGICWNMFSFCGTQQLQGRKQRLTIRRQSRCIQMNRTTPRRSSARSCGWSGSVLRWVSVKVRSIKIYCGSGLGSHVYCAYIYIQL